MPPKNQAEPAVSADQSSQTGFWSFWAILGHFWAPELNKSLGSKWHKGHRTQTDWKQVLFQPNLEKNLRPPPLRALCRVTSSSCLNPHLLGREQDAACHHRDKKRDKATMAKSECQPMPSTKRESETEAMKHKDHPLHTRPSLTQRTPPSEFHIGKDFIFID